MKNVIATEGRLLVKVNKQKSEHVTSGGIVIASKHNPDLHEGIVVNVGHYKDKVQQRFEVGQIVYWQNYSGVRFDKGGEEFIIINQSDIIGVEGDVDSQEVDN